MANKYYLTIGINDYPHAPLQGCVNDAIDVATHLTTRGYTGETLLNSDATKGNIISAIEGSLSRLKYGDLLVVHNSTHGSWIPDKDGDEPDGRDEVWCAYDYESGGLIVDDELHALASNRKFGTKLIMLADSCFSGSVNRFAAPVGREVLSDQVVKHEAVRYLPPEHFLEGQRLAWAREAEKMPISPIGSRTSAALISGCADGEYSYDAWVDNRYNGAFTYMALKTLQNNPKNLNEWHKRIRDFLPNQNWDQSPQLSGTLWQKNRWMV